MAALPGEPRFERDDFLAREPELGQSQAGMTNQDLAVTGRRHAAGMPVEELHIEGAFDLAQQFGGGRLRKARRRGGPHQATFLVETDEQRELACLQVETDGWFDAARCQNAKVAVLRGSSRTPLCAFIRHPPQKSLNVSMERGSARPLQLIRAHMWITFISQHIPLIALTFFSSLSAPGTSSDDFE